MENEPRSLKRSLCALAILALVSGAYAAETGFHVQVFGGVAFAKYTDIPAVATIPEVFIRAGDRVGPTAGFGGAIILPLGDLIFYQGSFEYVQKGTRLGWYYWDDLLGRDVYRLDELAHSSFLKFKPFRRLSPYALAGYSVSYVLAHKRKDHAAPGILTDLVKDTKRFEHGAVVGCGLEFEARKWGVFVEYRRCFGLTNLSKGTGDLDEYQHFHTRTDSFLAGIRYRLGGKRIRPA